MKVDKDFVKWIRNYEHYRTNPFDPNSSWMSKKYDIVGRSWAEISEIIIEDLPDQNGNPMNWGQACGALKHTWDNFSYQKKQGTYRGDLAFRIVKIQRAMGLEESSFPELNEEWLDHELSLEERKVKLEEMEEEDLEPEEEEEDESEDWENW